jgi:hypothetical protein
VPRGMPGGQRFGTGEAELVWWCRNLSDPTLWDASPTASPQRELAVSDHEISSFPLAAARDRSRPHADSRQPAGHPLMRGETTAGRRVRRVRTAGRRRAGRLNGVGYG